MVTVGGGLGWGAGIGCSRVLKCCRLSSKFLLLLRVVFSCGGGWSEGDFGGGISCRAGGGNFLGFLVDLWIPVWVNRFSLDSNLMNIFWPNWGWGFFFLIVDFVGFVDLDSLGIFSEVVIIWGVFILGIFLGDEFSDSWHNFLLGVHILGKVGGIFFAIFGCLAARHINDDT